MRELISVLKTVKPQICEKILNGDITTLLDKNIPYSVPFKGYIYCAKSMYTDYDRNGGDRGVRVQSYYNNAMKEAFGADPFYANDLFTENDNFYLMNGKVVGEFTCNEVDTYFYGDLSFPTPQYEGDPSVCDCGFGYFITCGELEKTGLTGEEIEEFGKGKKLYGWKISDLKVYDTPKDITSFYTAGHCFCQNKMKLKEDIFGNYHYIKPKNAKCYSCNHLDDFSDCDLAPHIITKSPTNWCYIWQPYVKD